MTSKRKKDKIFEKYYMSYSKLVYFVISKYVKNQEDIKDLVQEVFLKFYKKLDEINLNDNIKAYLTTSASNIALNYIRDNKNKIDIELDEILIQEVEVTSNKFDYDSLISLMKKYLTNGEIEIIIMHSLEGLTFKEIGIKLTKPTNTIITIYHRAIKKFRKENK